MGEEMLGVNIPRSLPKYRGAYDYKTGRYIIPVDKEFGAVLPEVTITPKNNLSLAGSMRNDWIKDTAQEALEFTPVGDAYLVAKDATEGYYLQAGIGAGLLLLPNALEKLLKEYINKGAVNGYKLLKFNSLPIKMLKVMLEVYKKSFK